MGARVFLFFVLLYSAMATAGDFQKVAIIDTGLNIHDARFTKHLCQDGHRDFTGRGLWDTNGHGTHVAGLVQQYARDANYCVVILKYWDDKDPEHRNTERFREALRYAGDLHVDIVNLSIAGPNAYDEERDVISDNKDILFVTAAGNEHKNIDDPKNAVYPACYHLPNIVVVGNGSARTPSDTSNFGSHVSAWENGEDVLSALPGGYYGRKSGTSMATAIHTGKVIYARAHAH